MLTLLAACSTTSNLPEGEMLYTGIKAVNIDDRKNTPTEEDILEELDGVLAYAPNNSFFGSSSIRTPLPVGLWVYNSMAGKEYKGIKKWFFNTFSSVPRTISMAAPETRIMVARNTLENYGYFHNSVDYELVPCKNPRMQKIVYNVHLGPASMLDSVSYHFPEAVDSIIRATSNDSYLAGGKQFSVADLQNEKLRLSTEFHNNGFYYYRPDYIKFIADSINYGGNVRLIVVPDKNIPVRAQHPWKIGRMSAFIRKSSTTSRMMAYDDTINFQRLTLAYQGKVMPIKPRVMFRGFKFWTGRTYNESRVASTIEELTSMGEFSNVQFTFTPHDTTDTCSILDCRLDCTMDKLIDSELEFNISQKSNAQVGGDIGLTFAKRNAFRHGETLSLKLRGSYYWQTRNRSKEDANNLDSYNYGADVSLVYPWLCFPWVANKVYRLPTSTKFSASFTRENVANAYRFNKFSVGAAYTRKLSPYVSHTFTPLEITLVDVRRMEDVMHSTLAAAAFLNDEFTPAIAYSVTYDNSVKRGARWFTHAEASIKEAGNIIGGIQTLAGRRFSEVGKNCVFKGYSQFVKLNLELRNRYRLTPRSSVATRLQLGGLFFYGNSNVAPISEWYYVGGANSIRAFGAKTLGPGGTPYTKGDPYYLHGGNLKFEANVEYRFPLFGDLNGALFIDAGNVWNMNVRHDNISLTADESLTPEMRELLEEISSDFSFRRLGKQLALGTGFGFRYDMQFLVLRLDVGIALHAPYKTSRSGYYNIPHFWRDGVAIHFAVGYPF